MSNEIKLTGIYAQKGQSRTITIDEILQDTIIKYKILWNTPYPVSPPTAMQNMLSGNGYVGGYIEYNRFYFRNRGTTASIVAVDHAEVLKHNKFSKRFYVKRANQGSLILAHFNSWSMEWETWRLELRDLKKHLEMKVW